MMENRHPSVFLGFPPSRNKIPLPLDKGRGQGDSYQAYFSLEFVEKLAQRGRFFREFSAKNALKLSGLLYVFQDEVNSDEPLSSNDGSGVLSRNSNAKCEYK
jgi:hypothetical protein